MTGKAYTGPAVFVQGVHYAVGKDGHADLGRALRVNQDGTYRDAVEDEPLHNDVHFAREAELPVGGEN